MNIELLETFHQNYPETSDGNLERIKRDESSREVSCAPFAVCLQFNRLGSLIALGCNDGRIEIWDFITRHIAKTIIAHPHPICCLSWNRDSRVLLSCSTDNTVCIWDVLNGDCLQNYRFPCPVLRVQFNPRATSDMLICPMRHPAVLLKWTPPIWKKNSKLRLDDADEMDMRLDDYQPIIIGKGIEEDCHSEMSITASFDRRGKYIFTANSKGKVCVYDSRTLEVVNAFKATSAANSAIKSIEFSRRGDSFLLNCADKIIRVYDCKAALTESEPEPKQKLRDLVTQSHWRKCCFSGDGEYVCAGSMKQHAIYMWERASGTLVKILQGQKGESLMDVVWHPLRPIVVSLSNSVTKEQVTVWAQTQVQNWSAFAPDFKELDENVEYEEKESEFDLEDEDKSEEEVEDDSKKEEPVDVETIEPVQALLSSDEDEEPEDILYFLPISPEMDNQEEANEEETLVEVGSSSSLGGRKRSRMDSNGPGSDDFMPQNPKRSRNNSKSTIDIDLPNAPRHEVHPLSTNRKPQMKQSSGLSGSSSLSLGSSSNRKNSGTSANRSQRDRNKSKK